MRSYERAGEHARAACQAPPWGRAGSLVSSDVGSALLLVLMFIALLTAVGAGLISLVNTERLAARNQRVLLAMRYAADAMAARVVAETSREADWSILLCCGRQSSFMDASAHPATAWGEVIDLSAETQALQLRMNDEWNAGSDTPQWQLYATGRFGELAGTHGVGEDAYLLAWIADDPAELDHDPSRDSNGVLIIRAQALGFRGVRGRVQVVLKRTSNDGSESNGGSGTSSQASQEAGGLAQILPDPSAGAAGGSASRTWILTWRNLE